MARYADFEAIADAPASITTEADHQAQEIILRDLRAAFPNDAYCAEEATPTLAECRRAGPRLWVIDPIDGTRGFARKNGEFSVMVALVEDSRIALGVVHEPARERITYAVRGHGCWREDAGGPAEPCRVSHVVQLSQSSRVQSRGDKPRISGPPDLPVGRDLYTYSAGIKLALVARGEADFYMSRYPRFNLWDFCAGQILVQEAGGRVTDRFGHPIQYTSDGSGKVAGIVASNGRLHDAVLGAM